MWISLKVILVIFISLVCNTRPGNAFFNSYKAVNGGSNCVACTVIVSLIEQLAIINNQTIEKSAENLCNMLPSGLFRYSCQTAIEIYGPVIINGLYAKETPDVVCQVLRFCTTEHQPECRIFPSPKEMSLKDEVRMFRRNLLNKGIEVSSKKFCDYPEFKAICKFINRAMQNREPSEDIDGDGYSEYEALRGTSWRGKDCNDVDAKVHPGARGGNDSVTDSNCNGIYGVDSNDGIPYEEKFCKYSQPRGIISLGDSITAHFHLPEEWFDATKISAEAFGHVAFIIENEADWPQLSGSTGHIQNTWPVIEGNTSSIYLKLWQRNKCNFRDYQNIGVNGADTVSMNKSIVRTFSRDQNNDNPVIVLYSLVGNDVCNGHPNTFDDMTKPEVFYDSVVGAMEYLDTKLPNGSHVLLTGLANGSYLYGLLSDRIHPLGRLRSDITYATFYTYLSCLQVSPCNGWMTTNDTVRYLTTQYAEMLSGLVKNVTQTHKFKNFDMAYTDFPLEYMLNKWISMGGEPWQVIEPVDGFHINQYAHAIYGDAFWEFLEQNHPDWLGPENKFNDEITRIFGNQGGY